MDELFFDSMVWGIVMESPAGCFIVSSSSGLIWLKAPFQVFYLFRECCFSWYILSAKVVFPLVSYSTHEKKTHSFKIYFRKHHLAPHLCHFSWHEQQWRLPSSIWLLISCLPAYLIVHWFSPVIRRPRFMAYLVVEKWNVSLFPPPIFENAVKEMCSTSQLKVTLM